jgi:hypothetical protein
VQQWDRLSDQACYMLLVPGPSKIDLIFADVPHTHERPWTVETGTLPGIDDHFWDWILWLVSKVDAGKREMVATELTKMHDHLLGPMGVAEVPNSLREAVARYLELRHNWERELGVVIDPSIGTEIGPILAGLEE